MKTNDNTSSWFTLRVYWYGNLDALIVDIVPQCLSILTTRQAYFSRHWARGPHLCLHFIGVEDEINALIETLTAILKNYQSSEQYQANPPTREMSERLAAREQYRGCIWPPLPHGHISIELRERSSGIKNGQAAERIIDLACYELNECLINLITQCQNGDSLHDLCFQLMLITIDKSCPDIKAENGFLSYRSHAELFLTEVADEYRERFDQIYHTHNHSLRRFAEKIFQENLSSRFFIIWRDTFQLVYQRSYYALKNNQLDLSWEGQDFDVEAPSLAIAAERSKRSAFHRIELANPKNLRIRSQDARFNAFRIVLNAQYMQFTRLGLTPLHRSLLCHLCANTVEDYFGVNGLEMISRYSYTRSQDAQ